MQDKMQALWQRVEPHLRWVVGGAFVVLLGVVIYLSMSETPDFARSDEPPATAAAATTGTDTEDKPKKDKDSMKIMRGENAAGLIPIQDSPFRLLTVNSMFDVKAVRNAIELEKVASQKYAEALSLWRDQQFREALSKCDEVLAIKPDHTRALDLRKSLEEKLNRAGVLSF